MEKLVSDKEIAENIGKWSMGELAWTFSYYKDKAPHLYAILACHPSISEGQRKFVIVRRWNLVKEHLMDVERESLDVVIDRNGTITKYTPEDFTTIRDQIKNQLTLSLKVV